jgi:alpha-beta hydrolase superfamily lysophospholipase
VRTANDHLNDLVEMIDYVRSESGTTSDGRPLPLLVLGHSMGGAFAAQCVARALRPLEGLILSSPALDAGLTPSQRLQLSIGSALVPWMALSNQLSIEFLSHDAAVVDAYQHDPLVHDRVTPRLARAIVDAGREVIDAAPQWRVPTLLLWAGADRNVSPAGSARFAARAPATVVTATVFPTLYHEIFNEPDAHAVFAALAEWLEQRAP